MMAWCSTRSRKHGAWISRGFGIVNAEAAHRPWRKGSRHQLRAQDRQFAIQVVAEGLHVAAAALAVRRRMKRRGKIVQIGDLHQPDGTTLHARTAPVPAARPP